MDDRRVSSSVSRSSSSLSPRPAVAVAVAHAFPFSHLSLACIRHTRADLTICGSNKAAEPRWAGLHAGGANLKLRGPPLRLQALAMFRGEEWLACRLDCLFFFFFHRLSFLAKQETRVGKKSLWATHLGKFCFSCWAWVSSICLKAGSRCSVWHELKTRGEERRWWVESRVQGAGKSERARHSGIGSGARW